MKYVPLILLVLGAALYFWLDRVVPLRGHGPEVLVGAFMLFAAQVFVLLRD